MNKDKWCDAYDQAYDAIIQKGGMCVEDAENAARAIADEIMADYEAGLGDYLHDQWKDRQHA